MFLLTRPETIPTVSLALLLTCFGSRAAGWRSGLFASYATSRVLPADTPLRANILTFHKTLGLCEAQRGTWVLTCSLRTSKRPGYHRPSARRIGGLSREVSCLSRQNELDGHRPTDVTGSPRSAQKSLSPGSGRDCSLPNKLAAMRFFAIAPLCLRGTVPVQTGSPRAFEWH